MPSYEEVKAKVKTLLASSADQIYVEYALMDALALLPVGEDPKGQELIDLCEEVISLFDGVPYSVFRILDETPAHFGYTHPTFECEWHWKLRKTRNTDRRLFAVLT